MAEFVELFRKHPTWGYRMLYAGKVKALRDVGRIAIPRSEVERLLANTAEYFEIVEEIRHRKNAAATKVGDGNEDAPREDSK